MFKLNLNILSKTIRQQQLRFSSSVTNKQTVEKAPQETKPVSEKKDNLNSFEKQNPSQISQVQTDEGRLDDLYRYLWIKCSAHQVEVLDSYERFIKLAAKNLDIEFVKTEEPFRIIKRRTLLASRHVHKKYRVQYEHRNYFRYVQFKNLTGSTADTFLEYIERNLPEGVLFIAEKHRLSELPFDLVDDGNADKQEQATT